MDEIEWAVIRRFSSFDNEEGHIIVDYQAKDREDAERVLNLLVEKNGRPNNNPTRWRVASRPKVVWTDAEED